LCIPIVEASIQTRNILDAVRKCGDKYRNNTRCKNMWMRMKEKLFYSRKRKQNFARLILYINYTMNIDKPIDKFFTLFYIIRGEIKMKIALAPVKLKNKDVAFNMSQIKHYMQQAKENNAILICFGESYL